MAGSNLNRLQKVASGLGDLNESVVYVGGAVAELYVSDPAATDIRPTMDVDCVIELASYKGFNELCELLRGKGFQNDQTPDAPICRWIYQGETVDIMPDDEGVIGFSNMWYHPAIINKEPRTLPDGTTIYVFSVTYYVATKFEALAGRGGDDLRTSHDFEDIIYILNSCPDFIERFQEEKDEALKQYLKEKMVMLTSRSNIMEEIECALPIGEDDRTDYIFEVIEEITQS
ncbi:nucleotidyl transferase AbiEii/AbiGii toxin family protein [Bacteroides hominis]|uniref:nucleotidyl transferase AbiEii/AbiGii toxin family protein n=1 Tax=Bacteroides hominis TaxID=2763023 RepID=UPI002949A065|nr:nucleotidyl transferase AbiEii/AbiGii toxin family protein [Bacteroides hominis (ex Liu et al. 2022)]MDV6135093.1 nucleotidyl transferase AbiEii/AbiGii toxin family protein [Bacteroides hominis (ex Liu et al. 2022)]MDV6149189.1 nucleotidyl transferase AbiEii/AbiGii toxin family protein [Bacteroides hominis (ex Liu et al. 2022)]